MEQKFQILRVTSGTMHLWKFKGIEVNCIEFLGVKNQPGGMNALPYSTSLSVYFGRKELPFVLLCTLYLHWDNDIASLCN